MILEKMRMYYRAYNDMYVSEKDSIKMEERLLENEAEYKLNTKQRKEKIIVSLTSFPARFNTLHFVIRSMLMQTMPPDEIILYLDDEDIIEKGISQLPKSLNQMQLYGLKIEKRTGNIKPHKKYYYVMKERPDDIIITVDDDIIYPSNLIEALYTTHLRFNTSVVATRAHKIMFDNKGKIKKYNDWKWACSKSNTPSLALMATGCGGVLYPPHCMHTDLFNINLIMKLSPNADDLWLKIMQILVGTKVVICDSTTRKKRAEIVGSQIMSLNSSNVHKNVNDKYMEYMIKYYKLNAKNFGA